MQCNNQWLFFFVVAKMKMQVFTKVLPLLILMKFYEIPHIFYKTFFSNRIFGHPLYIFKVPKTKRKAVILSFFGKRSVARGFSANVYDIYLFILFGEQKQLLTKVYDKVKYSLNVTTLHRDEQLS